MIKQKKTLLLTNAIIQSVCAFFCLVGTILFAFAFTPLCNFMQNGIEYSMSVDPESSAIIDPSEVAMLSRAIVCILLAMLVITTIAYTIFFIITFVVRAKMTDKKEFKGTQITLCVFSFIFGSALCAVIYIVAVCLKDRVRQNIVNNANTNVTTNIKEEPQNKNTTTQDVNVRVQEIKNLRDSGIISQSEFVEMLIKVMKSNNEGQNNE